MNLTNEERIERLNKIIQEAQEQKRELIADRAERESVDQWEQELGIQVEETEKAAKSKGGAEF